MTGNACRIGIDIGGTFTDVILVEEATKRSHRVKVPSVPSDPAVAAANGVAAVLKVAGRKPSDVSYFCHGTTVATNAILEGKVAPIALVATRGFRDVLEIGRQKRPDPYSFHAVKTPPLVPRNRRFEIVERLDGQGNVNVKLDEDSVRQVARAITAEGVSAVAVSLIHSFMNPAHEVRVKAILAEELPGMPVYLSVEVLPEYREYERVSTVALSAAVAPIVGRYVTRLETRLRDEGLACDLSLMKSTGGLMPFSAVEGRAVETVLSGPAAGALAIAQLGVQAGFPRLIGIDIGGTSSDVCMVIDGKPSITTEGAVGEHPVKLPMIDIQTVGAGGGSVGWTDAAGGLHVGPQSCGADPGPACYGRQDTKPTVTDAHLLLGRLNPDFFAAGSMTPDIAGAERAIASLAATLGTDLRSAALGMLQVTESNMARAIRQIAITKGQDVREFVLLGFGGGGALHACNLADELDIDTIVVPEDAGLLSAHGLLVADIKVEQSLTRVSRASETKEDDLLSVFGMLEAAARSRLHEQGVETDHLVMRRSVDMRYAGQAYEINVFLPAGAPSLVAAGVEGFNAAHAQLYWWNDPERPIEFVTPRLEAIFEVPKLPVVKRERHGADPSVASKGVRNACFASAVPVAAPIYDRERLQPGHAFDGPAIVESFDTTLVVNPGFSAVMDGFRHLVITRKRDR